MSTNVPPFLAHVLGDATQDQAAGRPALANGTSSPGEYNGGDGHMPASSSKEGASGRDGAPRAQPRPDATPRAESFATIRLSRELGSSQASTKEQVVASPPARVNHTSRDSTSAPANDLPILLVPPLNFDMVCARSLVRKGAGAATAVAATAPTTAATHAHHGAMTGGAIYRSGFPNERNYPFLATLRLRTVIYLSSDDVRPNLQQWIDSSNGQTQLLHFKLSVNKEPFAEMDKAVVAQALSAILDRRNSPLLMHCNKGKYRVGVITALIRRMQGWSMTSIYEEYARFAGHDRIADEEFIDTFPLDTVSYHPRYAPDWLRM